MKQKKVPNQRDSIYKYYEFQSKRVKDLKLKDELKR